MDTIPAARRSANMRAIHSKDTAPELTVRRLVYRLGYRYRLHARSLPGCPDLVFPGRRQLIFVHGCFWHGHSCKEGVREPKSNQPYWREKIVKNKARDVRQLEELGLSGWRVLVVWECETSDRGSLEEKIQRFLLA